MVYQIVAVLASIAALTSLWATYRQRREVKALLSQAKERDKAIADLSARIDKASSDLEAKQHYQLGLVLDASMTAAEKIAKTVAERGDTNLKEYLDECMNAIREYTN